MAVLTENQASQLARAANDIAAVAAVGYLHLAHLHLYQVPIAILPTTPLATFTAGEATYTGYADDPLVWDVPGTADDGTVEVVAAPLVFRPTDAVTPNVIYGCYITDTAGANLFFFAEFDSAPLPMQTALQQIIVVVRYRPATDSIVITIS
jgi:hypothetical protein